VLDALRDRGTAVTPRALLRITEAGAALNNQVLGGLERLVRSAADVPRVEALLEAMPAERVGNFLTFARGLVDRDLPHLLALADDPARGARLLAYADSTEQLFAIMQAGGQDLGNLDKLFTSTLAHGPQGRNPAALQNLLGRPGNTLAHVTTLVERINGDAGLLDRTITTVGSQADLETVLNLAQNHAATRDPAAMRRFLQVAEQHSLHDAANMREFINRVQRSQASPAKMNLDEASGVLDSFATHHTRSTAPPPTPAGHGPNNLATPTSQIRLTLADGSQVDVFVTNSTIQHVQEGHTFENFWFDPAKIERSGQSTFYPPGTGPDQIVADALAAIGTPQFLAELENTLAAKGHFVRPSSPIDVGGTLFELGVRLPEGDVRMFYPAPGPQATSVQKHVLWGVKAMLQL
jgi:hypothetical protein